MKVSTEAHIGDTLSHTHSKEVQPLPGFRPAKPMVFAGLYPNDSSQYSSLRTSLEKLLLNDSSVELTRDASAALGQGWRAGFMGLLHMDVFTQRLKEEFNESVLVTTPSVTYKALMKDGTTMDIVKPSDFPSKHQVKEYQEPMVMGTLILPDTYLGKIIQLCEKRRGEQVQLVYLDTHRVMLKYTLPLSEVVIDLFDQIKSLSSGYASFDYEHVGYQTSNLVKVDILVNSQIVDSLSCITHADKAYDVGKTICNKLKMSVHRQLFEVTIQAAVGGRVIARENLKALRKDVTAKCVRNITFL
jgi:elongation factor 4